MEGMPFDDKHRVMKGFAIGISGDKLEMLNGFMRIN
jgi:hypothetical protein